MNGLIVHSSVIDIGHDFSTYFTCRCGIIVTIPTLELVIYIIYYINFLFSPVTVSFNFCSMANLRVCQLLY